MARARTSVAVISLAAALALVFPSRAGRSDLLGMGNAHAAARSDSSLGVTAGVLCYPIMTSFLVNSGLTVFQCGVGAAHGGVVQFAAPKRNAALTQEMLAEWWEAIENKWHVSITYDAAKKYACGGTTCVTLLRMDVSRS